MKLYVSHSAALPGSRGVEWFIVEPRANPEQAVDRLQRAGRTVYEMLAHPWNSHVLDPSVALRALRAQFNVQITMRVLFGDERNPDGSFGKFYDVTVSHKGDRKTDADFWYLRTCGKSANEALLQAAELLL